MNSELLKKSNEQLRNELAQLQIQYSQLFLAASLRERMDRLSLSIKEIKDELNKRMN